MAKKVLVADASLTVRKQVAMILHQKGVETVEADSIEGVLATLHEHQVVAVLSGLDLKGSDPRTITKQMERFLTPDLPLILMFSNDRDVQFCDWIARNGIAGCVQKPISENLLVPIVSRVLSL